MGCISELHMVFPKEKHARWARHVAEEMIKLIYAPDTLPWVKEAEQYESLCQQYLLYRHEAAKLNFAGGYRKCALDFLERNRTVLSIDSCQDISRWTGFHFQSDDFFPQLCFAYMIRFPQVPFEAYYRYEMTVSGAIQLFRVVYDGSVMHVQERCGDRPMDEDDWSTAPVRNFVYETGGISELEDEPGADNQI